MIERSILLPSLPAVSLMEILIVLTVASLAYFIVFDNFENHVPAQRRVVKLFLVVGMLTVIGILFSRYAFWGAIVSMIIGQVYLHGWYFPKHGINSLTAEPHDKYLEVIAKMKGNEQI